MDDQRAKRKKTNLKILGIFAAIILLIIIAGASGSSKKSTNSNATQTSPASKSPASTPAKAAAYQATLLNGANTDPTSMMLPAAGFDHNNGWDTAAQASIDSSSATAIQPAVTVKDVKTLELNINVKNIGTAAGSPTCTIKASNNPSNFEAGQYFGVNAKTITALNGSNIQPGNYGNVVDDLTISNQGAAYIKAVAINCQ